MGLRRALAAPLQASPFILASLYAIVRALLKERPWSTQARAQKELTDSIPRVSPGTRVCVYGLSANPPTGEGGHATIVAHLRRMFDEVWVLPVYRHAFDSKSNLAPYDHRVRMCELAFGLGDMTEQQRRTEKVKVLDVERAVVRAAWDRHRVAEEEAKRVRADAHARRGGGGGDASSSPSSRGDGGPNSTPGAQSTASESSAAPSPKARKTPPMSPSASIASDAPISPFKSPTTIGAEPSAGPGATNVRAHHPERHPHSCVPPPKVGSFDVITAIREANPFASFSWCLGADTFADLRRGRWRNGAEFAALCTQLYVVPRVGGAGAAWEEIEMGTTRGDEHGDGDGDDEHEIDALLSGMGGDEGLGGDGAEGGAEGAAEGSGAFGNALGVEPAGFVRVDNASVMDIPGMSADVSSTAVRDALRRRRRRIHERERANGGKAFTSESSDGREMGGRGADLLLDEATLATAVSEDVLRYVVEHGLYA